MKQRKELNFQEAGLTSHYIFQELLKEPYIFQSIVEEILQYQLGEIERVERDPKVVGNLYSHEIVCDLLAYIKGGGLCNLELQNRDMKNFLKRTRYYVSQLQVNHYLRSKEEKDSYDGVPQVISVWLCTFPNFQYGDKKNTLVSYNKEIGMVVEDGVVRVFIDITKWEKFSPKLQELFHFILQSDENTALQANWDIVKLLYRNMIEMKKNPEKEGEFMTYNKAREEGFEEGREEGREESQIDTIRNLVKKNYALSTISDAVNLSVGEIQHIIQQYNLA